MKKVSMLILSVLAINSCIQGAQQSSMLPEQSSEAFSGVRHIYKLSHGPIPTQVPTDVKAKKCDEMGDYFETEISDNGYRFSAISYFDLKDHKELLVNALKPDANRRIDLRQLEALYCKKSIASMNVFVRNRGKLGFMLGAAAATFLVTGYLNSPLAVKQSPQE